MALRVGDFTAQVRDGGSVRLNEQGNGLTSFARGFKGKVVAFFRGIFKPGTVARENRAVMTAFITAIRQDRDYGEEFGNQANMRLTDAMRIGRPLNSRTVRDIKDALDQLKQSNLSFSRTRAMVVSENEDTRPGTFGSLFADKAHDKELPVLTRNYDTRQLRREINDDVMDRAQGGTRVVSETEARNIANDKIDAFLDNVKHNIDTIRLNMPEGEDRTAMEKGVLTANDRIKPKTITCARELQGSATTVLNAMAEPSLTTEQRLDFVKAFLDDVLEALERNYDDVGSDDLNDVLKLALGFAGAKSGKTDSDYATAFESCKGFRETVSGLGVPLTGRYVRSQTDMDNVRKAGNALTALSRISEHICEQSGRGTGAGTRTIFGDEITHPSKITESGRRGMQALGVPIPTA